MKSEITAGLVSSAVAIPLSMAYGMFAFVLLGDEYFAYGAMAGLVSTVIAGLVCVLIGDRSTRIYAPRITTTFFLGLLLHSLLERTPTIDGGPDVAATLLVSQEHLPLLHAINEGKLPKFADGGPVSKPITLLSDVKTSAGQGGGGAPHVHINAPVTT